MEIYDLCIVAFLGIFAIIGFKRGFFKSLVMFIGFILVVVLAYLFKNLLGDFLVLNLPFIKINKILGGAVTLNIILYQTLAFFIVLSILILVYKILVTITGIFEKILKYTVVLGIPSKLLGLVVGFIEGYVIIYLILFFITQPFLSINVLENSKYANTILNHTPIISQIANKSLHVYNEVRNGLKNKENADLYLTDLMLKEKVVSPNLMQQLVDSKKIEIEGIQDIIDKYKGDEKND